MVSALRPTAPRPAVVLLHTGASSPRQWVDLVEALAGDFRVLAVDFHGHGHRADWCGSRALGLQDDAALAVPLLEHARGAHVVGHGYGAAVAMKLATMHPQLVHTLVAFEPLLLSWLAADTARPQLCTQVLRTIAAMHEMAAQGRALDAARAYVELWAGEAAWAALLPRVQLSVAAKVPALLRQMDALLDEPVEPGQLARLGMPKLFLRGGRTAPALQRVMHLVRVLLPKATHIELPDVGHCAPLLQPAAVNERIRAFLRAQSQFSTTLQLRRFPSSPNPTEGSQP